MESIQDRENKLRQIKDEVVVCKKCSLYKTRRLPVIGKGNHQANIVFVGEAPGFQEDRTGRPFCGSAGKVLDYLLMGIGIKREDIYITNILKCRPPGNRDPKEEEIRACAPYLERQIEIIKPNIICSLGRFSMAFLMKKFGFEKEITSISNLHGKVFKSKEGIILIPFYHPAVAVYNPKMKEYLKKDFQVLKKFLF